MSTPNSAPQAADLTRPEPFIKPGEMYLAFDRYICDSISCAGMTALYTGTTRDGARLEKADVEDVTYNAEYPELGPLRCDCGALEARLDDQGRLEIVAVEKTTEAQQ